jgi:hypothetical protein
MIGILTIGLCRFVECEKWRKEFGTNDLVDTFDYVEKPKVFTYYPQYYHKTDKVCFVLLTYLQPLYRIDRE